MKALFTILLAFTLLACEDNNYKDPYEGKEVGLIINEEANSKYIANVTVDHQTHKINSAGVGMRIAMPTGQSSTILIEPLDDHTDFVVHVSLGNKRVDTIPVKAGEVINIDYSSYR